jgi:hypothetical protein
MEKQGQSTASPEAGGSKPVQLEGSRGISADPATPNAKPLAVDELRVKLDAAIDAEQWAAVVIIRERIVEAERTTATNVVPIDAGKGRRR